MRRLAKVKVTNGTVMEILDKYHNEGWTQGQLSRHYGLAIVTIGRMVRGESHQRVTKAFVSDDSAAALAALDAPELKKESAEVLMARLMARAGGQGGPGPVASDTNDETREKFESELERATGLMNELNELKNQGEGK